MSLRDVSAHLVGLAAVLLFVMLAWAVFALVMVYVLRWAGVQL